MQELSLKPRILILHGWGGSDFPHWQSWLAAELAKNGYPVYFPELPFMHTPRKKCGFRLWKRLWMVSPLIELCVTPSRTCYGFGMPKSTPKKILKR